MQVNNFKPILRFCQVDKLLVSSKFASVTRNYNNINNSRAQNYFNKSKKTETKFLSHQRTIHSHVMSPHHEGSNIRKLVPSSDSSSTGSHGAHSSFPFVMSGVLAWLGIQEKEEDKEGELVTTIKRGILAVRNEDLAKASQMFHLALRMAIDLRHEEAQTHIYCLLANCAIEQGMLMQAERLFSTVLQRILAAGTKQDSNAVVEISLKLANIFMQHGDAVKAEQGFNFCLETMNKKMKELEMLGGVLNKSQAGGTGSSVASEENAFPYTYCSPASPASENDSNESSTPSEDKDQEEFEEETAEDTIALWGMTLDQRGQFCISRGKLSEAKDMFTKAEAVSLRLHGHDHEQTLVITNSIATVLSMEGHYEEAVVILLRVVEKARQIETPFLATFLVNLGLTKLRQGMAVEARKWCGEGLNLGRRLEDDGAIEQGQKCLLEANT